MRSPGSTACGVGVDFGTTNSTVALFDGKHVQRVDFPPGGHTLPSALYIGRDDKTLVGDMAVDAYFEKNLSRIVTLTRQQLGDLAIHTGEGSFTFNVHAWVDQDMPGRLLRSLKRWLGTSSIESVQVFERRRRLSDLISLMLEYLGSGFGLVDGEEVYVGRPVHFGGDDELAQERLRTAAVRAGYTNACFYPEPVAAAVSYLHSQHAGQQGDVFLCFDFGGGTLDLCLMKGVTERFQILATHGIPLGGDLIDQRIFTKKVFPLLGDEHELFMNCMGGTTQPYRFKLLQYEEGLLNWQLGHKLSQPSLLRPVIKLAGEPGETGRLFRRLYALIRGNMSYCVLRAIEQAKIRLSDDIQATISVPELDLSVPMTRKELDDCLSPFLVQIEGSLHEVLAMADMNPSDVSVIICTGGSSRIPSVKRLLNNMFSRRAVQHDTFGGVAAGLAIAHYRGYVSPLNRRQT